MMMNILLSCILSLSYIKPQPSRISRKSRRCCILSLSYIKPQLRKCPLYNSQVVSYLFPISNHNSEGLTSRLEGLYLISFLYQTTTREHMEQYNSPLYLISFLYQTTTGTMSEKTEWKLYLISFLYQTTTILKIPVNQCPLYLISFLYQTTTGILCIGVRHQLYLISFLYQTTTMIGRIRLIISCILSLSYIKPQLFIGRCGNIPVVSYLFPISNHNSLSPHPCAGALYLISFLYQTTTYN